MCATIPQHHAQTHTSCRWQRVCQRLSSHSRVAVAVLCAWLFAYTHSQTTDEIGYPDPRYSKTKTPTTFSCAGGPANCPDGGEYTAAGGNLTLTIIEMRNLPDLDSFGLAGLLTDAYIEASIGDNVRRSGVIDNSLHPKWRPCASAGCRNATDSKRDLNFGFRPAGTEILVRVLDEDAGMEFGDDVIAEVTLHAIYCSGFTAIKQRVVSTDDSVWKMPLQPLCVEEMWIPLVANGDNCVASDGTLSDTTPCMRVRMTALPFQMRTEQVFLPGVVVSGGMGGYYPTEDSWLYGRVYSASDTRMLSYFRMDRSRGGLLIRPSSASNNDKGNTSLLASYGYTPYARVALNFAAEVFVFRRVDDAASTPEWLNTTFGWSVTREYAQLLDVVGDFRAVAQNVSAHPINTYGDAFTNGLVTGANLPQTYKDNTLSMYFIIAAPHTSYDVVPPVYSKAFSRDIFLAIALQYLPNVVFIAVLVLRYLRRMNWRVERVHSFLAEKVIEKAEVVSLPLGGGSTRSLKPGVKAATATVPVPATAKPTEVPNKPRKPDIVAMLFFCYNESPLNVEFRRNLFYATFCVYVTMFTPVLVLVSWGVTCILLVTPPAMGFALIFLGVSALCSLYAIARWSHLGWRMTDAILRLLSATFVCAFAFLFSSTFADPKVFIGGEPLDFFPLTAIFLTLNMVPMIWIAFTNDAKLTKSLGQIVAAVGASKKVTAMKTKFKNLGSLGLKLATAKATHGQSESSEPPTTTARDALKRKRKASAFAPLMGDHYSVEQSVPGFNRADILNNAFVTPAETRRPTNRKFYASAVAVLVIYCIVAGARSSYPVLAVGIAVTVLFVDCCIFMLTRGFVTWSAGYIVLLLSSVRVCLAATSGDYWILGHAFLYMVFGTALCIEVIGKNLPRMNKQEAGGVTFFGHDHSQWRHFDASTTPEFVLGFLSFFYIFLLLAVAFGEDGADDATIHVAIGGQSWPLWIFGVLAFIVVLFVGLALATSRAFFLQREQLLSEYATRVYLFVRAWTLPFMLAAAAEVLVICSGLFVFATTRSSFILVTSIFAPLIWMLALAVYAQWVKNDYRLVIWPPEDDEEDVLDNDDAFDADDAMEKEAALLRETFVLPPLRGRGIRGGGVDDDDNDKTFKMPALPPKNLLTQAKLMPKVMNGPQALAPIKSDALGRSTTATATTTTNRRARLLSRVAEHDATRSTNAGDASATAPLALQQSPRSQRHRPRRCAFLRDLFARRVSCKALFSKQAWRKYKAATTLASMQPSASSTSSPRGGGSSSAQPLLGLRRQTATSAIANDVDVDFTTMSLYAAYNAGFLLPHDYATLGSFGALLSLVFLYGVIISFTETPMWIGHVLWTSIYILVFSLCPTIKYFRIAALTSDMKYAFAGSYALAWLTALVLFVAVLDANVNAIESLVLLSLLVFYPIFLVFGVTLLQWREQRFESSRAVMRTLRACVAALVVWIVEMYIFASVALGAALTFVLALFLFAAYLLTKWVANDRYLAPKFAHRASAFVVAATALAIGVGLIIGLNLFFCLSIVFIVLLLKYTAHFISSWFVDKDDVSVFYSPYLFPVFSYNAYTNNVVHETQSIAHLYVLFVLAFSWGVSGVLFFDPLGFGVGLCSLVLLVSAGVTAHLCAVTPVKMGIAAKYVNEMILKDASAAAKDVLEHRRKPFTLESAEFVEAERREKKAELEFQAIAYGSSAFGKNKKRKDNAIENDKSNDDAGDATAAAVRRTGGDIALEIDALERSCRVHLVDGREVALPDGLLTWRDACDDIFQRAIGPFGFLYLLTLPWRLLRFLERKYVPAKWSSSYIRKRRKPATVAVSTRDDDDNDIDNSALDAAERGDSNREAPLLLVHKPTDLVGMLLELPVLDEELDRAFFEETRCIIHFQLLMLNAADARLSREKILFQQFLRENRFKLMSNGINPPANIFKTSSFASIDIPLVAVWLLSLTPEARARFHALKAAFNDEMERVDAIVDAEDAHTQQQQRDLRASWQPHEEAQCRRRMQEFYARRMRRDAEGIVLEEENGNKPVDEAVLNANEALLEIESGYSCTPGALGRALQFVDREFPPDETSIAGCANARDVVGWKVSTAINVVAGLFDGGTDPDDVIVGKLNDSWLLSAISIIAASGGVDDGKVDALIDRLFITKQTSLTGAYALRLYKNCQWETVIVDDHFPVLSDAYRATPSAGAAFAHSKDFEELWVPLLEKAFAKYYGGYAALERGFVHHALAELTGCDAHEVCLAQASRGSLKRTLWQQLLVYKRNKFLMGAGTISSENADTAILDTGLVFGACYVVYDVRELDGHELLLLRNPPGDHDEWKGDWSDHSKLWTRRLKKLLHVSADANDNTFWMSFDDFCHVFRSLYICRYYDPSKWPIQTIDSCWQGDTACGVPTRHNLECTLECNPQFALRVDRPTELLLRVTQVDAKGLAPATVLPIAVYIVAQGTQRDRAKRVTSLTRESVVAHSGEPVRQRDVHVHCELDAQTFTVLVAAYKRGMEGPFRLHVQSNYPVGLEQLWPAVWKDPATATAAEKMAARVLETVGDSAAVSKLREKKNELVSKLAAGAAVVDQALRDDDTVLRAELAKQQQADADAAAAAARRERGIKKAKANDASASAAPTPATHKHVWIEQWDESASKPYYYNKATGMSSWDKPADM